MRTILITGAKGQLGTELGKILKSGHSELGKLDDFYKDCDIVLTDIDELDLTDTEKVLDYIEKLSPYAVVNCAAMTNVDQCEEKRDVALKANAIAPRNLAMACERVGAKLLHVSTDYVFEGVGSAPYTEWDVCSPQSAYGASKRLGEEYVQSFSSRYFIVRTAWLYGYYGKNFVKTIARVGKQTGALKVVDDQRGNPTNAADLAYVITKLLLTEEYGIYHCTGKGECSWYDFACKIIEFLGIDATVSPCTTEESGRAAKRPAYSSLDNAMLRCTVGDYTRDWEEALRCFCDNAEFDD